MVTSHNLKSDGDWRLPFDVMLNVMAISPPSIISALMKLCHALYNKGPKHLLCDGVRLSSEVQVMLFTNFMMTKDPSRFAHLRELELAFSLPFPLLFSDGARLRLAGLLSHPALAVETLILHNAAWVLGSGDLSDAWLCEAFGRLRVVKHLALLGVRGENEPAIRAFPSKLESVSIGVDRPLVDVHGWPRFDVLSTLRPFADTLHTLLLKLEPNAPALSLLQNSFGVDGFPHVRTFGIVYDDSVPALLASPALAQTFPALTNLQLIPPTLERSGRHRRRRLETAAGFREGNQVRRSQYGPGGSASPGLASLVECSGRLFDVYALALNHTLSTLRIWQDVVADDLPILRAVLEDTRPERLCLSMEMHDRDVEKTFAALRTLLAPKPPPRVDLNISLSDGVWHACIYKDGAMKQLLLFLMSLIYPRIPPGLAEFNLFIDFPPEALPVGRSVVSQNLVELAKWASTTVPSLRLSCEIAVDADWLWPDLGQGDLRNNPFSVLLDDFWDSDDDDDDGGGDDDE